MLFEYDEFGWLIAGGTTPVAGSTRDEPPIAPAEPEVGKPHARWIGTQWVVQPYFVMEPVVPPLAPPAPRPPLTRLDFRRRFTVQEKVALDLASIDDPSADTQQREMAAMLRVFLAEVSQAEYISLDDPDTIAGVNSLAQFGLIAQERVAEILE